MSSSNRATACHSCKMTKKQVTPAPGTIKQQWQTTSAWDLLSVSEESAFHAFQHIKVQVHIILRPREHLEKYTHFFQYQSIPSPPKLDNFEFSSDDVLQKPYRLEGFRFSASGMTGLNCGQFKCACRMCRHMLGSISSLM